MNCLECNKELPVRKNTYNKYCNNSCQNKLQSRKKVEAWLRGEIKGWVGQTRQICKFIRNHLLLVFNNTCQKCGWNEVHPIDGRPLVEIDHIDGDAENCHISNLQVLCPNCHSMTATFRARNKVSKRIRS